MLVSAEEITELKKAHHALDRRMEKIKNQLPTIVRLFGQLKEAIESIESIVEKEKTMWNPAFITRVKLAKKGMQLGKGIIHFEIDVVKEFENHNISEEVGKRFVYIIKLIRENKMQDAKEELNYFEEIVIFNKEYNRTEEEMKEKDQILKKEQFRIEKILEEIEGLEKETIDLEKVHRYEQLLKNLEKLKGLRTAYIQSLLSKPVVELLEEAERHSLKEYYGKFPEKNEMAQLRQFFSDYPVFGKYNAEQICEFFECSEKKLSHVCPETSRFKKVVLENRNLFETVGSLEQTAFLAVDEEDEKAMEFYIRNVEGAHETIEQIRQLKKEKNSNREEYEKNRRIEKRKEEFVGYSKTALEGELKAIKSLLELLHAEAPEENVEERHGLLSEINLFIKKLAGKRTV